MLPLHYLYMRKTATSRGSQIFCCRFLSLCLVSFLFLLSPVVAKPQFRLGDERTEIYLPLLEGKRVALFSNHTGCNQRGEHVLDVLLQHGVRVTTLFSPEHGFRGTADAGEHVKSGVDDRSGLPIVSLYDAGRGGPATAVMQKFDVLLVDIQDVGLRYYTYYITMLRLMERCGQCGRDVVVLDRPNPNGHFVDGPLLDMKLRSGVGALPIPIVHGMTLGELALMAQGEGWVKAFCRLTVVPCEGYSRQMFFAPAVAPSPNLPDMRSILLYPSTCCFEGTCVSLGRGTDAPFQMYGHPRMEGDFSFTPVSRSGAKNPPLQGQVCHGVSLQGLSMRALWRMRRVNLSYVVDAFRRMGQPQDFFLRSGDFFDKLMGQRYVREMILSGHAAEEIETRWRADVEAFCVQRRPYLLYDE